MSKVWTAKKRFPLDSFDRSSFQFHFILPNFFPTVLENTVGHLLQGVRNLHGTDEAASVIQYLRMFADFAINNPYSAANFNRV